MVCIFCKKKLTSWDISTADGLDCCIGCFKQNREDIYLTMGWKVLKLPASLENLSLREKLACYQSKFHNLDQGTTNERNSGE